MLPFLKNKQEGGMSAPVDTIERTPDDDTPAFDALDAVADDLLAAFESKDKGLLKSALEALVEHIQDQDAEQDQGMGE